MTVSVDRDFARIGSKSYAIKQINSVDVTERHPHGTGALIAFVLLSLLSLLFGISGIFFVLLFAGLAYWAWKRSKIVEYQLFLRTSSAEGQAIASRDRDFIFGLRSNIERAIAGQIA